MFLHQIDITGFRGINQLTLMFNKENNILIGENRWGRSSLISALKLLSFDSPFYQFVDSDFHYDENKLCCNVIELNFTYGELENNEMASPDCAPLSSVRYEKKSETQSNYFICYRISARKEQDRIITEHYFVDEYGVRIINENEKAMIQCLLRIAPVLCLKNTKPSGEEPITNQPLYEYYIDKFTSELSEHAKDFEAEEVQRGLSAASALLDYYFADNQKRHYFKHVEKRDKPTEYDWGSLGKINDLLDELDNDYIRTSLLGILCAVANTEGIRNLSPNAKPVLVLEEPESQLHPIMLSVGFRLLNNFPIQKIVTSNSSDLVSLYPLHCIYHLVRLSGRIEVKYTEKNQLSSGDNRRILFHIIYRRPTALFARSWILVEGETEVWLLRELAEQCGYHLNSEGIQLIEFAQCGLRPLIKYANSMGIYWHVLTDGDMAGKKYADAVGALCPDKHNLDDYLTILPAKDIENFLFKNGFSHVYKMAAYGSAQYVDMPVSRIIQKAIHRTSKPDLAIAICDDAKTRGITSIPNLFSRLFHRVVQVTNKLD